MATDVVNLWNMALSASAAKGRVSDPNEESVEADICRVWYDRVRRQVLKSASWPCAKKYARLALLSERVDSANWLAPDPDPTYSYKYAEPADSLAPRHLADFSRFSRGIEGDTKTISANMPDAILHYIVDQENVSLWDEGLISAVADLLAARISMEATGKSFLYDRLVRQAEMTILKAQTELANESEDHYEDVASWHAAGGYTGIGPTTRFYLPLDGKLGIDL